LSMIREHTVHNLKKRIKETDSKELCRRSVFPTNYQE
jgi:hypothetical protein